MADDTVARDEPGSAADTDFVQEVDGIRAILDRGGYDIAELLARIEAAFHLPVTGSDEDLAAYERLKLAQVQVAGRE